MAKIQRFYLNICIGLMGDSCYQVQSDFHRIYVLKNKDQRIAVSILHLLKFIFFNELLTLDNFRTLEPITCSLINSYGLLNLVMKKRIRLSLY